MNMHNLAMTLRDDITTLEAAFKGGGHSYFYAVDLDLAATLEVGDLVVVETGTGFAVVKVAEVHDAPKIELDGHALKWVASKVDVGRLAENKRHMDNLTRRLKQHRREAMRDQALKALGVPDAATLIKELKEDA